ncbi:sugar-non-specific nuclease inhibitor NuiA [Pseudanabaena sp. lw0831]|uniref:nuclease A inhibitor family protein n=1 Tax=Pseudanabaena sp. lw0831 TaxID=1357935 RepID=UPI00191548D6|nr:nuclease A inhibitor family protein [Pseudanabaena sp. lw0831]GBO52059.1 sugar-non-specific nuclease inhibitor NuiA [Pseudanabaena sp. lw0831]
MTVKEITDLITKLSTGLLFPSESEYPLEPFTWKSTTLNRKTILPQAGKPAKTPIEEIALEEFFAPIVTDEEWFEDEDREIAQRFRDLQTAIATLENAQVFPLGKVEIDVFIVGEIGQDLVGLKIKVIET